MLSRAEIVTMVVGYLLLDQDWAQYREGKKLSFPQMKRARINSLREQTLWQMDVFDVSGQTAAEILQDALAYVDFYLDSDPNKKARQGNRARE